MNDSVGQGAAEGSTAQTASLLLLTEDGDEVSYSPDRALTQRIWQSSIFTEGPPQGAVVVLLNITSRSARHEAAATWRRLTAPSPC